MREALVTGSAGFVGCHMVAELARRGYEVNAVDIREGNDCLDEFRWRVGRYDLIVHAAAVEPHRAAIDGNPMHLAANLQLDSTLFDWAVRTQQGRVLYLSSSASYPVSYQQGHTHHRRGMIPTRGDRPLSETDINLDDIEQPDGAYGWTKLTGERMAAAAREAGLPVTVVRPFSGYGEDQGENWPFGAFAARARRREDPFVIWGDGQQVRDWIHIDDVVFGALALVDAAVDGPINLCTGRGISMRELVGAMCAEAGYSPEIRLLTEKPAGVAYRVGDPSRLHEYYKPIVSIEEGVERALAHRGRVMLSEDGWRHESAVYAEAAQEQPAWAVSEPLGLCPMVCPDHSRHCTVDLPHDRHRCSLC